MKNSAGDWIKREGINVSNVIENELNIELKKKQIEIANKLLNNGGEVKV